ncbi:hypothetical protein CcCBS67573_g06302 [Chytriomyces confervae]|uniref:Protein DOM34 homolog n=1 Tax=Chytriomyces confervae TaxID=246404 RepID=A0A507F5Z7_9FUNG|nr:hypothetical protein CcCBS67573_g06302 [Chytriomyces confervae]
MKLVRKNIDSKDGSGSVTLVAEEQEDMWHAYNLVLAGDSLKGSTIRRVVTESATGSTDKSSVRITLTIQVETVEFDTQACMLRVNGRNVQENKFVKMGGYHTLDLEMHKPFTISKESWDMIALDRIQQACDVAARADIAAILLEEGLATLCLVTSSMTLVRGRVEVNVPRKRKGSSGHEKGMKRFFEQCYQAIQKSVDFNVVKVLIVASPGFYKEQLFDYMKQTAVQTDNKEFLQFLPKILLIHCSSGQKHALGEALADEGVQSRLEDTKFATEVRALAKFFEMLARDPDRAFYGFSPAIDKSAYLDEADIFYADPKAFIETYFASFNETRHVANRTDLKKTQTDVLFNVPGQSSFQIQQFVWPSRVVIFAALLDTLGREYFIERGYSQVRDIYLKILAMIDFLFDFA